MLCSVVAVVSMVMRWTCRVQLPVMDASKQWQLPMAVIAPEYEHLKDPRPRSMRASGTIVMPEPAEVPQPQVQQAPEVASAGPDAAEAFPGGSMQEKAERLLLDALPCLASGAKEDLPGGSMDEKSATERRGLFHPSGDSSPTFRRVLNLAHAHREKAERESAKAAAEEEAEYEAARAMQLKRQDDRHRLEARRRSSEEDVRSRRIEALRTLSERGRPLAVERVISPRSRALRYQQGAAHVGIT